MKGMELPINILVLVAIAVIVLIGLIAMYTMGIGPFAGNIGIQSALNSGCSALQREDNCGVNPNTIEVCFDANKDGTTCCWKSDDYVAATDTVAAHCGTSTPIDTLQDICTNYYGKSATNDCKALCGCPGYS